MLIKLQGSYTFISFHFTLFYFSDLWGRLENESGLTASNVAKYDALHSMVVFKEHPPSHWDKVLAYMSNNIWAHNGDDNNSDSESVHDGWI